MAFSIRKLGKRFFILTNVLVCFLFLLACLQPWLNPVTFWPISFLSLTLPYLSLLVLAFLLFWILVRFKYALISLLTLVLGWKQVGTLFATQSDVFAIKNRKENSLRVMTWNVKSLLGIGPKTANERRQIADDIARLIDRYDPDVLCLQEFGQMDQPEKGDDNIRRITDLGLKYYVLSKDYSRVHYGYSSGLAIFSRYPLFAKKRIQFTSSPESLLEAWLKVGKDTIAVYTAHLQSFKLIDRDFDNLQAATENGDNLVEASGNIFSKMKRAFRNRGAQADQIRPSLDTTRVPEIFCGDLNDVPGSYAYWQMRGRERRDAHLDGGWGIGRTFMVLAPTLRIDFIFADSRLQTTQCSTVPTTLSDHLPVVADMEWVK